MKKLVRIFKKSIKCSRNYSIACFFLLIFMSLAILIWLRLVTENHHTYIGSACNFLPFRQKLCREFKRGLITGNLCEDICSYNTSRFEVYDCPGMHAGKEFVFFAVLNGKKVVLKAKDLNIAKTISSISTIENMISMMLMNCGFPHKIYLNSSILNQLKNSRREDDKKSSLHSFDIKEYALNEIFKKDKIFPLNIGYCGQVYATEKLSTIDDLFLPRLPVNFKRRLKLAIKVIEFLRRVDEAYKEDSMLICDIKLSHLGFDAEQNLKFIDADTVEFSSTLLQSLKYQSINSSCDISCNFFDCQAVCNNNCIPVSFKNNLQRFIDKLFRHGDAVSGLLQNYPKEMKNDVHILFNSITQGNYSFKETYISTLNLLNKMLSLDKN